MNRLYLQIYLTLVGIIVLFAVLASLAWLWIGPSDEDRASIEGIGAIVAESLPAAGRPVEELRPALARLSERLRADLAVRSADGELVVQIGRPLPEPTPEQLKSGWFQGRRHGGPVIVVRLPDDRWMIGRPRRNEHGIQWLVALAGLGVVSAIGAYPLVRRLTRRVERLRARVEQLGAGDLSARVQIEGRDEIAALARSFNRAADRIEALVDGQRTLLASASHELRSPLARIRVATELLHSGQRPELLERIEKDIGELDVLIGELLLASRLDALDQLERVEEVDLLALVAEESSRAGASLEGEPVRILGDSRMLRHLVRNLVENAQRYGAGTPIEVTLEAQDGEARLRVLDRGPGVPEIERERIFGAFYRPAGMRESIDGSVGLGLSLVRQIAGHHEGHARCIAREGGGTCFEVVLPGARSEIRENQDSREPSL